MNKPRLLCIALCFVFSIPSGKGQNLEHWLSPGNIEILNRMQLKYTKPVGFSEKKHSECFGNNPKLYNAFRCLLNRIDADDGEMVFFLYIHPGFEATWFNRRKKEFPSLGDFNQRHIAQIKAIIHHTQGIEHSHKWKKYVTFDTPAKAKAAFNADTVITLPVKLDLSPEEYFEGKYRHVDVMVPQKNDRAFVMLYLFHTDKAKKQMGKYRKAIESMLYFSEPGDFKPYPITQEMKRRVTIKSEKKKTVVPERIPLLRP